jgi:cytochrome b involved in lipid metabolism
VSNYLEEHPGGGEVLKECAGTDATIAFEDVGHSDGAIALLEDMLIGELADEVCIYPYLL